MDFFNIEDWNEQQIQFLIDNNVEESINIEFKSSGGLSKIATSTSKEDIAKDVSAFANSDGGFIFYGIKEKNHKADSIEFIDGTVYTKEWLESVISTGISRRIDNLKIYPVRFGNDVLKTVYVVKIPVSYSAPHIVNKSKIYYKRYNFMACPMEEYEVRQTYERKENIILEIGFIDIDNSNVFRRLDTSNVYTQMEKINIRFKLNVKNVGRVLAKEYKLKAIIPNRDYYKIINKNGYTVSNVDTNIIVSNSNTLLLFPDEETNFMNFYIGILPHKLGDGVEGQQIILELLFGSTSVKRQINFTNEVYSALQRYKSLN